MTAVYKARMSFDVLLQAESAEAARSELAGMDIGRICEEADTGSYVMGNIESEISHVAPDDVAHEAEALGSDASFFGEFEDAAA